MLHWLECWCETSRCSSSWCNRHAICKYIGLSSTYDRWSFSAVTRFFHPSIKSLVPTSVLCSKPTTKKKLLDSSFLASFKCNPVYLQCTVLEEHREKVKKAKEKWRRKNQDCVPTAANRSRSVSSTIRRSCWGQCWISKISVHSWSVTTLCSVVLRILINQVVTENLKQS